MSARRHGRPARDDRPRVEKGRANAGAKRDCHYALVSARRASEPLAEREGLGVVKKCDAARRRPLPSVSACLLTSMSSRTCGLLHESCRRISSVADVECQDVVRACRSQVGVNGPSVTRNEYRSAR